MVYKCLYFTFLVFHLIQMSLCITSTSDTSSSDVTELLKNETRLTNLNFDVQMLIMEKLDFNDLVSLAEVNGELSFLASHEFRRRHSKKTIKFSFPNQHDQDTDETFTIDSYPILLKALKHFGHMITKLKVEFYGGSVPNHFPQLSEYINFYCSESLVDLNIHHETNKNFFDNFHYPFTKVENLTLSGKFNSLSSVKLTFDQMFPVIRNLNLGNVDLHHVDFIDRTYSNLKYVRMRVSISGEINFSVHEIETLLKNNQQIGGLRLSFCNRHLLNIISEHLPNLEILEIEYYHGTYHNNATAINFMNLKRFQIYLPFDHSQRDIQFEQLVEFTTSTSSQMVRSNWIDVVEQCKMLQKLKVNMELVNNELLEKLAMLSSNLVEVYLVLSSDVKVETITKLMKNNPKMKMMHLVNEITANSMNVTADALRGVIEEHWIVTEHGYNLREIIIQRNV